ncbi:MAG: helix-turn-helix domain-containing protein [Pseudonocardiaceae bacterium]
MTESPGPTIRRLQLGMELRRLREAAGKSQEDAAKWLGIRAASVSRIETGKQRASLAYLRLLLQLYSVGSPHVEALERLLREASQRGWWAAYGSTVPKWFEDYAGMETAAAEQWAYEAEYVPGLLQTPGYIRAIRLSVKPDASEDELRRAVDLRQARQARLVAADPLTLRVVINEAVIRRLVGGPEVMGEQLRHVAELSEQENITVQVLPFDIGAHPGMLGTFALLKFDDQPLDKVFIEIDGAALYLEKPDEIQRYTATYQRCATLALDTAASTTLIADAARHLE